MIVCEICGLPGVITDDEENQNQLGLIDRSVNDHRIAHRSCWHRDPEAHLWLFIPENVMRALTAIESRKSSLASGDTSRSVKHADAQAAPDESFAGCALGLGQATRADLQRVIDAALDWRTSNEHVGRCFRLLLATSGDIIRSHP